MYISTHRTSIVAFSSFDGWRSSRRRPHDSPHGRRDDRRPVIGRVRVVVLRSQAATAGNTTPRETARSVNWRPGPTYLAVHSYRSALTESRRVARRAGQKHALRVTTIISVAWAVIG